MTTEARDTEVANWLMSRARREADAAMEAFSRLPEDPQGLYLHAGMAVEFAFKAVLAQINVLLIADSRKFEPMWELATSEAPIADMASRLKTISLSVAIDRVEKALPELGRRDDLKMLALQRNGAAHLGVGSPKEGTRCILAMLAALRAALARHSGDSLEEFLGRYGDVAVRMLSQKQSETEKQVLAKIVAATARFEERWGHVLSFNQAEMLHGSLWADSEIAMHECPACQTEAAIGGLIEVREHIDYDQDGPSGLYFEPLLWPDHFECRACGLELDGQEEVAAAEMDYPEGLALDGADADEVIRRYEQDMYEDYMVDQYLEEYRGR